MLYLHESPTLPPGFYQKTPVSPQCRSLATTKYDTDQLEVGRSKTTEGDSDKSLHSSEEDVSQSTTVWTFVEPATYEQQFAMMHGRGIV